ncbi:uridine diphosphate-N-acetylglucosamine-binding protein YvcK [Candidatus Poribacteria bacterium]|nr:uridine diphosphate-N-acetylglucosamine-binding protein YvcK [Candidatus Poribacteria bacterium]
MEAVIMAQAMALNIVCIGGGTGLSSLLRGIKLYTSTKQPGYDIINLKKLTAIVTVSDDGGSSGKLIDEFGVLPPGDIRNCLVALSEEDEIMTKLFEYRFQSNGGLSGHSVGNLLLIALTQLNNGSFPKAIEEAARVLAVQGRILPATLDCTTLCAELKNGEIIRGESHIPERANREPIKRVFLIPRENNNRASSVKVVGNFECHAHNEAVEAIKEADAVIIGPGSLYTSIMPNLVVKGICDALEKSAAMKIYICNVMSEPGETDRYSVSDHVQAILNHVNLTLDYVLVNNGIAPQEIIQQYVKEGLLEQFTSIKSHADEAINTLKERTEYALKELAVLSNEIVQLSQEATRIADASRVQVLYNEKYDHLDGVKIVEEGLIHDVSILDKGVQKRVIRHDPYKLARTLTKLFSEHPKLNG